MSKRQSNVMSSWIEIILNKCKLSRRKLMRSTVWIYLCRIPVENVDIPRGHAAKFSTRYFFFFNFFYYFLDSVSHPGDLLLFLGKKKLLKWQDKKKKEKKEYKKNKREGERAEKRDEAMRKFRRALVEVMHIRGRPSKKHTKGISIWLNGRFVLEMG